MKTQPNAQILARLPQAPKRAELIAKSKQLQAAIKNELQQPVLQHPAKCAGAMVFVLEDGSRYCLNCGGDHA